MELKDERPIVVGIGEALLDCFHNTKSQDETKGREELGGAPLIFAYHATKSHCKGVIISAIGMNDKGEVDEKGNDIITNLKRLNLWDASEEYVYKVQNKRSGTVEVNNSDRNDPLYDIKTDVAWTDIPWSNNLKKLAKKTAAVYFGPLASFCGEINSGASKQTIDNFLKAVSKDCWKIFDVNLRRNPDEMGNYIKALYSDELIREYIRKCNVLKVNKEELDYLGKILHFREKDSDKIGEKLMKRRSKVRILILTKGEKGSTIFWRDEKDHKKVFSQSIHISVEPENTVGAGDAMVGAFIGELLNGRTISEAHFIAAQRSDLVCREEKSMPEITPPYIFVSYSWKDMNDVVFFCDKFKEKEIMFWRDKNNVEFGEDIPNAIKEAIKNSKAFVYFSSMNATESTTVKAEINIAIKEEKRVFIVKLDATPIPEELQYYSGREKYFSFTEMYDFVNQVGKKISKT